MKTSTPTCCHSRIRSEVKLDIISQIFILNTFYKIWMVAQSQNPSKSHSQYTLLPTNNTYSETRYTCQQRISTFYALVIVGKEYKLYLTSTQPQSMRYMLLDAAAGDKIKLDIWYSKSQRLDVYYKVFLY